LRTLIIKEFTAQLTRGEDNRNEIFGQLRDMYDCDYRAVFGSIDYAKFPKHWLNIKFGFIAGCTPFIDRYNRLNTILGERFLKVRLNEPPRLEAAKQALNWTFKRDEATKNLNRKVTRFIANLKLPTDPQPPKEYEDRLAHLVEAIVFIRTPISTKTEVGTRIYEYEEQRELGTRLIQQLVRLGTLLTVIRGLEKWNDEIYKTVCRVAFDTLPPERFQICRYLYLNSEPISQKNLAEKLRWSERKVHLHTSEMMYGQLINRNETLDFTLNPYIRKMLDGAWCRQMSHESYTIGLLPQHNNKHCITHYTVTDTMHIRYACSNINGKERRVNHPCYPCEQEMCDPERGCKAFRHWLRWGWW